MTAHRLARLVPLLAGLLIAPSAHAARAASSAGTAPAAPADSARQVLARTAAYYRTLDHFDIRGHSHVDIIQAGQTSKIEVPVRFAAAGARRYCDVNNPNFPTTTVLTEDSVWIATPLVRLYNVGTAQEARTRASVDPQFAKMLAPLSDFAVADQHLRGARLLQSDTVRTLDGVVKCLRIEAEYEPDTSKQGVTDWPRTYWIEAATGRVWRDSARADVMHPQLGQLTTVQVSRYVAWNTQISSDDTLFTFRAPVGTQRAMPPPPPPAFALKGKPAPDFTLPRYATAAVGRRKPASTPVRLSALKGKVVLLDFWATWCGPCRRWMPIVSKVHDSLKAKGLVAYAVNLRDPDTKIAEYLKTANVSATILVDRDGGVGERYQAASIPLTVIVGRDGLVASVLLGLHDEAQLREALKEAGLD